MQTLVLDPGLVPVNIVSWRRGVGLLIKDRAEVLEEYVQAVHPGVQMPAVVRLRENIVRTRQRVKFSRANVLMRDRSRCQYCGRQLSANQLTFDHVVPRSQGGKTVWENIVMACWPCNDAKRNRTPVQADMRLLHKPVRPTWVPHYNPKLRSPEHIPSEWRSYWTVELEP